MGVAYFHLADNPRALACAQRHLQLCIDSGERLGITLALGRVARAFAGQGQYQKAEGLTRQELALGRRSEKTSSAISACSTIR